ncbi:hypothetical protein DYH56_01315 [Psychrilyobacter piezotolerans]|uniref:Rod shape-determining protein MreD n=1 Tax=Psychrilyobacter piezotolerans TaxID=2293438 RepID=A0ABX9KLB1_9FUSO|nr:hypothetical protein [Psychrilyobacter sp. S5]RDE66145.1 hypothetical protein DV867_01315 [Psychrilyobacter sp. S5]REI43323.1 hypothetical protein DYH56_01315 [Psychrilyobacter piezotolerans]
MFNFFILIFIFLENSLVVTFPYNIIALPYLTYLAYKRGKNGIFEVILICIIISKDKNILVELGIVFVIIFVVSYFLSKVLGYEKINIIYYSLIQFIIYGTYLYIKLPYFYLYQGVIMFGGYLLLNYSFIKKLRKNI